MERLISSIAGFEAFGYEYVKFLTSTIPKAAISPIVDTEASHNIIVSPSHTYGARAILQDPDFVTVTEFLAKMDTWIKFYRHETKRII